MAALRSMLTTLGPTVAWVSVFAAVITSVFVLYIGLAVGRALFSGNAQVRSDARDVLAKLLDFFRRSK